MTARLARLEHLLSRNSRNSSSPPSRDDDAGRGAPPDATTRRGDAGPKRRRGKQPGAPGTNLAWTDTPDARADRFPTGRCGCGLKRRLREAVFARGSHLMDWSAIPRPARRGSSSTSATWPASPPAAAPSRDVEGVVSLDIGRDVTDPDSFIPTEVFEDRTALDRQESLPAVKRTLGLLEQAVVAEPEATIFEVSSAEPYGE